MRVILHLFFLLIAFSAFAQGSGEVIITEYYNRPAKPTQEQLDAALPNNPAGADTSPNEGHTEWFEIYNTTNEPVVMDGWTLTDGSSASNVSTIESFTIAPKSYAVFSGFNIPEAQGGVEFDYFYDYKKPSFNNESSYADEGDTSCPDGVVIAKADGSLVDQVLYDYGYGEYIGNESSGDCKDNAAAIGIPAAGGSSKVSFMLSVDPAVMNSADNDLATNWSFSTITYDETASQKGTPGLANDGSLPPPPSTTGTGEIIITEYYNRPAKPTQEQLDAALPNNPAGADTSPNEGHTEWFEVYNTTDEAIVMDGWTLTDASSSSNVSTIGSFTIAPKSYAVFSGFNIPEAQGGVEFDYFYDYKKPSFNNESSYADEGDTSCPDGVIIAKADGSLVDEVLFDYGYGEYIGNENSGSCKDNTEATGIPSAGSSSKVSFMLAVDAAVMNSADNDLAANWSFSDIVYDEAGNQVGTPGLANDGSMPPPPADPGTGEIIITEYYNRPLKPTQEQLDAALPNNPAGADTSPNEGHTEWFEVYNTTDEAIVMDGWTLTDASSSSNVSTIGSFTIAPKSYAVFSGFNIPEAQGGVEFDYFYDYKKPSFNNESSYADEGDTSCPDGVIIAKADGSLVDEVLFDYGYGEYIGNENSGSCKDNTEATGIPSAGSSSKVSFMLVVDEAVMNSADNNLAANWVFSDIVYDEAGSQIGTPGLANDGSMPPPPADFGTGEVIITEYYNRPLKPTQEQLDAALPNNPAGADLEPNEGHTEWFEIYNTTDEAIVMDGWTLTDASSSSNVTTIGSFTLEANSYAVFSGFNIPDAQGGYEFDYFYDYKTPSFNNESSYSDAGDDACPDGVIIAKADGSLVDEVRFDYGYGEYIGNENSGECKDNAEAIGLPQAGSSSKVSFMLLVDDAVMNSVDNDLGANWIFSINTYDYDGDQKGTPGLQNDIRTTSTAEPGFEGQVKIYPNPANTLVTVSTDVSKDFSVEVYDAMGRSMNQIELNNSTIDVSQLPVGIYVVKVNFAQSSVFKKITIQR